MEAEASSRRWESEAKEAVEREVRAKAERDATRHEASMDKLDAEMVGSARAQVEFELARVQHALAALEDAQQKGEFVLTGAQRALADSEEARRKVEDKAKCLVDERVSLILELGASKDELIGVRAEASKEKRALEEAFDAGFEVIFNYSYDCCAFAHNICGSEPVILNRMPNTLKPLPPKFFINPRCPSSAAPRDHTALGVHTTDPNVDVREADKSPPAVEVRLDP